MVFIDTGSSQAAIKAAQSPCPGRTVGAGGQQKQLRVGDGARAGDGLTGGQCSPPNPYCGGAAVQTNGLAAPFNEIGVFCASSSGFEVVAYGT